MIRQIKCICLLFALVFPVLHLSAQDPVVRHDKQYLDSIREVLANDYEQQLGRYRQLSEQESASNRSSIDSLQQLIHAMEQEMRGLTREHQAISSEVASLQVAMEQHEAVFEAEKQRFTILLLITGPALLALILLSTVLFYLLLRRQQESADRKISALKKYTYTEIEETRTDLMKKFRKRMKKMRENMKGNGGNKKAKVRKGKEKKPGKIKSKKK